MSDPVVPNANPGNGPVAGYTISYNLYLTNFNWKTWHPYEWQNWVTIDALINQVIGFLNIKGIWRPNFAYVAGESVFDPSDVTKLYRAHTSHTSGTNFQTDIASYWDLIDAAGPEVRTVFGRIGDVVGVEGDYAAAQITLDDGPLSITATDVQQGIAAVLDDIVTRDDAISAAKQGKVYIGDTAPETPIAGETLWYATSAPIGLFLFYDDGDSVQWVQTNGQAQNAHVYVSATAPNAAAVGELWLNSDTDVLSVYEISGWSPILTINNGYVDAAGDTMTGSLILNSDPAALLEAATKQYVDAGDSATQSAANSAQTAADDARTYAEGISGRNVLINGNMGVNQRGFNGDWSSIADGEYGYDRWKRVDASTIAQVIEAGNFDPSTEYTLSGVNVSTQQINSPASGTWTITVPNNASNVQLERGNVATPFERRQIGEELRLCQRYFYSCKSSVLARGYNAYGEQAVLFPTTMRVVPTIAGTINSSSSSDETVTVTKDGLTVVALFSNTSTNRYGYNSGWSVDAEL